jgi:hypothetical protein
MPIPQRARFVYGTSAHSEIPSKGFKHVNKQSFTELNDASTGLM